MRAVETVNVECAMVESSLEKRGRAASTIEVGKCDFKSSRSVQRDKRLGESLHCFQKQKQFPKEEMD